MRVPVGPELDALVSERVMGIKWDIARCRVCGWPLCDAGGLPPSPGTIPVGCEIDSCSMRPLPTRRADVPLPYSSYRVAAQLVVDKLAHMWTDATAKSNNKIDDFVKPFNDAVFFEYLHRATDRRWPWAFLYVTPEMLCRAALAALPRYKLHDSSTEPQNAKATQVVLWFHCPGCEEQHGVHVGKHGIHIPQWNWNGSMTAPTFGPSLLVDGHDPQRRCHTIITDGKIKYQADCHHALAGQTVDMPDWDDTDL